METENTFSYIKDGETISVTVLVPFSLVTMDYIVDDVISACFANGTYNALASIYAFRYSVLSRMTDLTLPESLGEAFPILADESLWNSVVCILQRDNSSFELLEGAVDDAICDKRHCVYALLSRPEPADVAVLTNLSDFIDKADTFVDAVTDQVSKYGKKLNRLLTPKAMKNISTQLEALNISGLVKPDDLSR